MGNNCTCRCNTRQPQGEYVCCNCGTHLELDKLAVLPPCPTCGYDTFVAYNTDIFYIE